jgi:hypothetical protein
MKKIIFFCNWCSSPEILLNRYKNFTKNNLGKWNNIIGTNNIDEADCIIFIEGIPNNFNMNLIKNKKVICFPREPVGIKNWENQTLENGFTYDSLFHVVTDPQFINKNYDFLNELNYNEHEKLLSGIVSSKGGDYGYELRKNFFINFTKKYPNLIDVYGFGWKNELGNSYKGELSCYHKNDNNSMTKYEGLKNYKYSICIENCRKKNYFTEKFTDALLCWTIPIYYGCSNISNFFPKGCYYEIDITKDNCYEEVINIINTPITEENMNSIKVARNLILNKYNIWNVINELSH